MWIVIMFLLLPQIEPYDAHTGGNGVANLSEGHLGGNGFASDAHRGGNG
jgi:hypothetical protein